MRRLLTVTTAAAAIAACAPAPVIPPTPAPLPDPCTLVSNHSIAVSFSRGVAGPATALAGDESSRSCALLVHDLNGDEHLVITVARNGGAAFASVCDRSAHPNILVVTGIGQKACWNPDDVSVSTLQHGLLYSTAIIDPVFARDYENVLESLTRLMVAAR